MGLLQATEVIKLITGSGDPLIGRLLMYDALAATTTELKVRRDPDCPIDVIGERPRRARVEVVLSNSFGFGGQNVTVALGNPEGAS